MKTERRNEQEALSSRRPQRPSRTRVCSRPLPAAGKALRSMKDPGNPSIIWAGEVDLDKLSQADATRLRELVAAAGFFSLPPEIRKRAPASWDFVHELTVRDAGKTHTVCFHLDAVPATLRALCDEVIAQAQGGLNDLRPT